MKIFSLISIITLCIFSIQAQEISKSVVANGGNDVSNGNYQLSQTIGEPMVTTHTEGNYILCQGFQQKDGLTEVSIQELNDFTFSYYPNPFVNDLNIVFEEYIENTKLQIYNQAGQVVYSKEMHNKQEVKLNLGHLNSGIYFVQFNVDTENVRFKIIKTH